MLFLLLIFFGKSESVFYVTCNYNGTIQSLQDNCTSITGNVDLTNQDVNTLYRKFAYVSTINGCLSIKNSNYQYLDFFPRLQTVNCNSGPGITVTQNNDLKWFLMPVFRTGQILASNNPRLCLLPDEVQRWGSILNPTNGGINSISQCAGRIGGQVTTCQSIQGQENGGLPDNCEIITNTLYLDMTNNNTDGKLQYITTIYGHLYIRSTNTSKISFPALERILVSDIITPTSSGEDPAVLFDKNGNLSTIEFPKLTRVTYTNTSLMMVNNPALQTSNLCNLFGKFGLVVNNVNNNPIVCGRPNAVSIKSSLPSLFVTIIIAKFISKHNFLLGF